MAQWIKCLPYGTRTRVHVSGTHTKTDGCGGRPGVPAEPTGEPGD